MQRRTCGYFSSYSPAADYIRDASYTCSRSRRNLEPDRAENLRLRFASSARLLQQTEQKAKIMAEKWRHRVNICYEKSSFERV